MKQLRANDVGLRRASRISAIGVVLRVTIMSFLTLSGCDRDAESPLAPQLLFDTDEMAAYLDEFPVGDYQIAEVANLGKFYVDDNPAQVKKTLLGGKPWEPHVIWELKEFLSPGDTVLDIGAHIGSITIAMARLIGPDGTVYAFEPQKKIYRELVQNIKLNELANAVPLRFAISSEPGLIEMSTGDTHDGRVSVGKGGDKVEARAIDSFGFSDVSLMKIDVEGHEVEVLRGAEKTIGAFHPVIIIEIWQRSRETVIPILEGYGYSLRHIPPTNEFVATYEPKP